MEGSKTSRREQLAYAVKQLRSCGILKLEKISESHYIEVIFTVNKPMECIVNTTSYINRKTKDTENGGVYVVEKSVVDVVNSDVTMLLEDGYNIA